MRLKTALLLLLTVLVIAPVLAFLVVRWHQMASPAPRPDFVNFGRYMTALNLSHDPVAARIRAQIDDGPAALSRERAAAQQEGLDLRLSSLQVPMPPPGQNAAPIYEHWSALRVKSKMALLGCFKPVLYRFDYTPKQLADAQQILDDHRDVMVLLHQAADKPQCVYREDWQSLVTKGIANRLGHADLDAAALDLNLESYLLACHGHYAEAITNQTRGFQVGRHAGANPTEISYVIGVDTQEWALMGMENLLYLAGPNPLVASKIRKAVIREGSPVSMKHVLPGDTAYAIGELEALRADTSGALADYAVRMTESAAPFSGEPPPFSTEEHRFFNNLLDAAEAEELHRMRGLIAAYGRSPSAFASACVSASASKNELTRQKSPIGALGDIVEFDPAELVDRGRRYRAEQYVLMAAAEVMGTKGHTGAFPTHLMGYYPDPFHDDHPLLYKREGANGFVVYSIGPTGKFAGGKPGEHHWHHEAGFRYPGPRRSPVPPDLLK